MSSQLNLDGLESFKPSGINIPHDLIQKAIKENSTEVENIDQIDQEEEPDTTESEKIRQLEE